MYMNADKSQSTNVHVHTWCTMHTALGYFCIWKPNDRASHTSFFMHSAFISMKTKTNMIAAATTDDTRTQYGRFILIESELVI